MPSWVFYTAGSGEPGLKEELPMRTLVYISASLAGSAARIVGTAYCTSKAALHMFSQCLAEDVREYNIAVNILDPGSMKSEGSSVIPWAQHDWDQRVEPEIAGPSAVYLALRDAQSLTGQLVLRNEFGQTWGI